jgi:hypothetical protein
VTDPILGADTPGPHATPAQDADVRALLGTLRAEDVPMPDDVVARIHAAITAERAAVSLPDTPASLLEADSRDAGAGPDATAHSATTATVLPLSAGGQRRGPSYTGLRRMLAVAAALVVVVGGVSLVRSLGLGSGSEASSAGGASMAPEKAAGADGTTAYSARTSLTGTAYTRALLGTQVSVLATAALRGERFQEQATVASAHAASLAPVPSGTALDACLSGLTGRPGVTPVVVDSGTFEGKPANVVVLQTEGDAAKLDVWVLAPGCSGADPSVLEFQRIPSP